MSSGRPLGTFLLVSSALLVAACATDVTGPQPVMPGVLSADLHASSAQTVYTFNDGQLVTLNTSTGSFTTVLTPPRSPVCCLAAAPNGSLYATHSDPRFSRELLAIDPVAGTTAVIGPLSVPLSGMAVHPTLGLIGVGGFSHGLFLIDETTADAQSLATYDLPFSGVHLADMAVTSDGAIYAIKVDVGDPMAGRAATGTTLMRIDPSTYELTEVGSLGTSRFLTGLTTFGSGLIGGECGQVYSIDPGTAAIELLTTLAGGMIACPSSMTTAGAAVSDPDDDPPPPPPTDPSAKQQCLSGGWDAFGFSNQGQCVRFIEAGKDSR